MSNKDMDLRQDDGNVSVPDGYHLAEGRRNSSYQLKNDFPLVFILIVIALTIGWVLTNLWTRFVENMAYITCGLNINSTWHTFIVAAVVTLLIVNYIALLQNHGIGLQSDILAPLGVPSPPGLIGNVNAGVDGSQ
jgi:hypothetical protein